jgi:hypothetical protein
MNLIHWWASFRSGRNDDHKHVFDSDNGVDYNGLLAANIPAKSNRQYSHERHGWKCSSERGTGTEIRAVAESKCAAVPYESRGLVLGRGTISVQIRLATFGDFFRASVRCQIAAARLHHLQRG